MQQPSEWMNRAEVAALFAVNKTTVPLWAARGQIPSRRLPSGIRRYPRAEIEEIWKQSTEPYESESEGDG